MLKIENERFAQQRAFEEVERAQKMMEEERKRGEILAIQDQAILRAQAEEDSAWFEKEKVIKEELIFSKKAARQEEELARHREQLGTVLLSAGKVFNPHNQVASVAHNLKSGTERMCRVCVPSIVGFNLNLLRPSRTRAAFQIASS